jgi:hypothetical protein
MNKQASAIVMSIVFAVGTAGAAYAASLEGANSVPSKGLLPRTVTGELTKIVGDNYTVKDLSGKEIHFQIDQSRTMMNSHPVVGDKLMAEIQAQGYAYSINPVASTEPATAKK